jgi:RHS repeat-associated protein
MPAITPAGVATAPASSASFEQYNSFNGALGLSIPLHHIGGRGEGGFDLVWNLQPNWIADYNGTSASAIIVAEQYPTGGSGSNQNSSGLSGPGAVYIRTGYTWQVCTSGYYNGINRPSTTATTITFVMPNGGQLSLMDTTSATAASGPSRPVPANFCNNTSSEWDVSRGTSFRSTDGSQIQFNASANVQEQAPNAQGYGVAMVSGTLVFPSGVVYTVQNSQITSIQDRNGNNTSLIYNGPATTSLDWYLNNLHALTQVTDPLGNVTTINYAYSDNSGDCTSCIGITYPGYGGATRVVKVLTGALSAALLSGGTETVTQLFNSAPIFDNGAKYNPTVATAIVMPDNSQYSFLYNSYGEVAQLTLPTGGYIQYVYGAGSGSNNGFVSGSNGVMIYRRLQKRSEYGSYNPNNSTQVILSSVTTHTVAYPNSTTTDTVQTLDPNNGNAVVAQTVHTFGGSPTDTLTMTGTSCISVNEGLETTTASGYPALRTVTNVYSNSSSNGCQTNPQLTSVTTKNDTGQQSEIVYTWDSNGPNNSSYGNITDEKDYDWGAAGGAVGGMLREIATRYQYQDYPNYNLPQVNLIHLPETKTISGPTAAATTTWRYDEAGQLDSAPNMINNCTNSFNNCTNNYGPANNLRGNMTDSYQSYGGGVLSTGGFHYDVGGNMTVSANLDGNSVTYVYSDSANKYAFPISITNALGQSTFTYDYNIGKPLTATDALSNTTTYNYADGYDRLTYMKEPANGGGVENIYYVSTNWTITTHTQGSSTQTQSQVVTDPMGRDIEDRTLTDVSSHLIAVDRQYNALGQISATANPSVITYSSTSWSPDGLGYLTTYSYDSIGRVTNIVLPDGNGTTTSYSGNSATLTDAASRATKTVTNGIGQVTDVYEDPSNSNLHTQYTYDTLGNLNSVSKCTAGISNCSSSGQTRTFTYDTLSRLTSAVNPESGTYTYSYSTGGTNKLALQSRTDPRGYTTTYGYYPSLDKLTSVTYNDGTPNNSYTYNANGQLKQSSNSNVTNNYLTFDGNGRVLTSNVVMGGVTYPFTYVYDLAGDLTQEVYPSGRTVNYTYDMAQRPLTVNGVSAGVTTNYVQQAGYFPHGAPQFWQYGNGLWCWQNVNKVLTSWEVWATQNNNGNNWMFEAYNGFDNSENVIAQTEGFGPGVPWNNMTFLNGQFQYDKLSRLTLVTDTNYTRGYHFDEFGNQSIQSYTGISPVGFAPQYSGGNPFNSATNHLTAVDTAGGYEARGMVTKLGSGTVQMAYDAEGNMKNTSDTGTGQSITWIFDAEGQRAQKLISGGSWTLYVHDAFGQLVASYNNNGVTPDCNGTCYLTYDMLGSVRLVTDTNQSVVARHDFIPFGEEIPNGTAGRNGNFGYTSNVTQGFTGQEADGGTASLDFYYARHFSAVLGSMTQPDPMNAGADIMNPQSWNGYGYVLGNPLGLVDPSGMFAEANPGTPEEIYQSLLQFVQTSFAFLNAPPSCSNCGGNNGKKNPPPANTGSPAPAKNGTCPAGATASGLTYSASVQQHIAQRHMYYLSNGAGAGSTIPSYNSNGANVPASQYMFEPDGTPAANWQLVLQINAKTFSLATPVPSRGNVTFTAPLGPQNIPFPLARPFIGVEYGGWLNIFGLKFPFPALPTDVNTLVTKADCQTVVTSHPGNP